MPGFEKTYERIARGVAPMGLKVCVEGNIGSGKSTLLQGLAAARPDARVYPEPVAQWGDLLHRYYQDPGQWGLALQLRALLSSCPAVRCEAPMCIVERGPLSCRHVFGQLLFNDGKLAQSDWELFKRYCDALGWTPDAIVYVQTPHDVCYERMRERGRPAESMVDPQYIRRLDFQYETMLRYAQVPVVARLDGLLPPDELVRQACAVLDDLSGAP